MKGQRAAAVNAHLRSELSEAREARRRLEGRLEAAERERDSAVARLASIEREGHPAVLAERARASAAFQRAEEATNAERERWEAICDRARPTWVRLVDLASESDAAIFSEDGLAALADLFGPATLGSSATSRNHRRNMNDSSSFRAITRALDEMEKRGVVGVKDLPEKASGLSHHDQLREKLGLAGHRRDDS